MSSAKRARADDAAGDAGDNVPNVAEEEVKADAMDTGPAAPQLLAPAADADNAVESLLAAASGAAAGGAADAGRKRARDTTDEVRDLQARVQLLIQAADSIEASLDQGDAQAIYGEYQATKRQLSQSVRNLNQLRNQIAQVNTDLTAMQLQRDQAVRERDAEAEEKTRVATELRVEQDRMVEVASGLNRLREQVNTLQGKMDAIQMRVAQTRSLRSEFGLAEGQAVAPDTLSNYYGVYVYNALVAAARRALQDVAQRPPAERSLLGSPQIIFETVLRPAMEQERDTEVATQEAYNAQIQTLLDEAPDDVENADAEQKRWTAEQAVVQARYQPDGGTIEQAFALAVAEVQQDPRLIAQEEKLVSDAAEYPVGLKTNYVLGGVANSRMYENDILPVQAGASPSVLADIGQGTSEFATYENSLADDRAWRTTPAAEKQRLLNLANAWADDAKLAPADTLRGQLLRWLDGVAAKLGLQFFQYAPDALRNAALPRAAKAQNWSTGGNKMKAQMQSACRENPARTRDPQKVIPDSRWKDQIIKVAAGGAKALAGVHGWFLMDRSELPSKLFGLVHGRDARALPDAVNEFQLATTDIGLAQGVPAIDAATLANSVDLTFVCAQRLAQVNDIDYSVLGRAPNQLGTLMILWFLVSLLDAGFLGVVLEVVGTQPVQGSREGYSQAPSSSDVAVYYHRYFKFQRTDVLDRRFFQPVPALMAFHASPEWNAYQATPAPGKELKLEIMYRPYPTVADLSDMVARLVQKVTRNYGL